MDSDGTLTVSVPLPGTRPSATFTPSLAGDQPWVILQLKATLVDVILSYRERLSEFYTLQASHSALEREMEGLRAELNRQTLLFQDFIRQFQGTGQQQTSPTLSSSSISSIEPDENDWRAWPVNSAIDFLGKYCDQADVDDIRCGPNNQRRVALYHGTDDEDDISKASQT